MLTQAVRSWEKLDIMQQGIGNPWSHWKFKNFADKMLVQHGLKSGKYSSLIRPSLFVLMSKYWLFFAFWGLTLEISGCFHYLSLILQNDIRPYKVDEMTYILCLTEWWSFISSIWVTTTFNRQWSISETLNSLTRKLLLFTFLFVFHSLSKLFNLKLLSNSWKQISRKLPKLKNLRNFHQTTREKSQEHVCHRNVAN